MHLGEAFIQSDLFANYQLQQGQSPLGGLWVKYHAQEHNSGCPQTLATGHTRIASHMECHIRMLVPETKSRENASFTHFPLKHCSSVYLSVCLSIIHEK